ncbi:hypothetical protein [Saccharothrix saharensis]|uniref:hypothetical protein n=1 Tax=Saccharothrix saharensis TaxID=571190 RepID=UPI00114DDC27|nr:hypothetical protein [Saccharothrix saharensis]
MGERSITGFGVLGPLGVTRAARPVAVPAGRARVLPATSLVRAGEVVTATEPGVEPGSPHGR